jgi:Protein of unknown function (DUF3303)
MMPSGCCFAFPAGVDDDFTRCCQVMRASDRRLLDEWMARWSDLIDFEVHPVLTSAEAAERISPNVVSQFDSPAPVSPSPECGRDDLPSVWQAAEGYAYGR